MYGFNMFLFNVNVFKIVLNALNRNLPRWNRFLLETVCCFPFRHAEAAYLLAPSVGDQKNRGMCCVGGGGYPNLNLFYLL